MTSVTVEGSRTRPCTELPRGERRTVQLTERVQRLIDRGYFTLIAIHDDEPQVAEVVDGSGTVHTGTLPVEASNAAPPEPPALPAKNGSRDAWAAWLDYKGVWFPDDAKRDDMVAAWEQVAQQQDAANE